MDSRNRQRGNDIGVTGRQLAQNVRTVRIDRGLTQSDVSDALTGLGHPIPASSIGKIESGLRKVEVDDLVALAVALGVSPLRLLLPDTRRPGDPASITGATSEAMTIWRWGIGDIPLEPSPADAHEFQSWSLPWWLQVSAGVPVTSLPEGSRKSVEDQHG